MDAPIEPIEVSDRDREFFEYVRQAEAELERAIQALLLSPLPMLPDGRGESPLRRLYPILATGLPLPALPLPKVGKIQASDE